MADTVHPFHESHRAAMEATMHCRIEFAEPMRFSPLPSNLDKDSR